MFSAIAIHSFHHSGLSGFKNLTDMLCKSRILIRIATITLVLSLYACRPQGSLTRLDLGDSYTPNQQPGALKCSVYNLDDSITECRLTFPLPGPSSKNSNGVSNYRIQLSVFNSIRESVLLDSISSVYTDSLTMPGRIYDHVFRLRVLSGNNYILSVLVSQQPGGQTRNLLKPILKMDHSSNSWFRYESLGNEGVSEAYAGNDEPIRIQTADTSSSRLFCRAFYHRFPPALPPFSLKSRAAFDYREDSVFILKLEQGKSEYIFLNNQGFYHFRKDTSVLEGFTVFRMHDDYPRVTTPRRMIESTRYICTQQEFETLMKSASPKASLDSFWISVAGNADRAVEMIREYYSRVEQANRLFFSYCEGWKTDRGMIYIIFGPPTSVYRSDTEEMWIYGETNNFRSLQFEFLKVNNPFTVNDFILHRQENYKSYWYNAIERWRR